MANSTGVNNQERLKPAEILRLAQAVVDEFFASSAMPFPTTLMLASIAWIESHGDPAAERYEPHLNDSSLGLCQVLSSTAQWLAQDMGYRGCGQSVQEQALRLPKVSMYFGAAYTNHLSKHFRSHAYKSSLPPFSEFTKPSFEEQFIVRGYNGGPQGYKRQATLPYWKKYLEAKAFMAKEAQQLPSAGSTATSQTREHVVQKGDTFWKLSQDHGCTVASLIELNPDLSNPNLLLVGDTIVVPNTFSESKGSSPPGVVAADTHVPPAQPSSKERSVHIASSHTPAVGDVSGEGTEADHLVKGQGAGLRAGWASSPWTRLAVKAGIRILVGVVLKQVLLPPSKKPAQRKK
mmetsp:Transcript_13259/g.48281  ORF Transcript_13259/g.48281 Transcript_13259/m.48281 type:complete len:348 (-) Transcript_13259:56-1099(-)